MTEQEKNRVQFPEIAKVLDKFREQFESAKVVYAKEGEHEKGRRPEEAE